MGDFRRLPEQEIASLCSPYIGNGRGDDKWQFDEIHSNGVSMNGKISFSKFNVSPTDPEEFHLSVFSALEIASQMAIILSHNNLGLVVKTKEVWLSNCSLKFFKPIRCATAIFAELTLRLRRLGSEHACVIDVHLRDENGGHFYGVLKGLTLPPKSEISS